MKHNHILFVLATFLLLIVNVPANAQCVDPNKYADSCDFDGDGVLNIDDLDDDNDGILDEVECGALNIMDSSTFEIRGSACVYSPDELTLTPDAGNKAGSAWSFETITLTRSFTYEIQVYLGTKDGNGADGIAFVIQPDEGYPTGDYGGGLGYRSIDNGIAIEFDTYNNGTGTYNDIVNSDHIALHYTSSQNLINSNFVSVSNMEDGLWHDVEISWNEPTQRLIVKYEGVEKINEVIALGSIFETNDVYIGYTASTGGFSNLQKVKLVNFA